MTTSDSRLSQSRLHPAHDPLVAWYWMGKMPHAFSGMMYLSFRTRVRSALVQAGLHPDAAEHQVGKAFAELERRRGEPDVSAATMAFLFARVAEAMVREP